MSGGSSAGPTGGVGGTTFGALSSIGSDLSVSVSFNIARELLDAAHDEQISEDELIGLVLGFAIVFSALQARLASELSKRRRKSVAKAKSELQERLEDPSVAELRWIAAWKDVPLEHVEEHKRLLVEEAGHAAEVALLLMWFCISVPLVFLGAFFGFKAKLKDNPTRTNEIPRQVPEQVWYMQPTFSVTSKTINVKKFSSSWKTKILKKSANFSNTMKKPLAES